MKYKKGLITFLVLSLMLFLQACEQKSDSVTDAVMAPYGSTVEMGEPVADLLINSSADWWFVEYRIFVLDSAKKPMNGIGINLSTSSPYAYFLNSGSAVDLVKTDDSGSALVVVLVLGGEYFKNNSNATSFSIDVWADIVVDNDVREITLTKGPDFI